MSKYESIMTVNQFMEKLNDIVKNYHTAYSLGVVGSKLTNSVIDQKTKQLPRWYTVTRITNLKKLAATGKYYGFDCVNTIKAILWDWDGTPTHGSSKKSYVSYSSHTVPDTNADGMIRLCEDVSTDMSNIMIGEAVWFPGHIGIYVGKSNDVDYVIECAPSINKVGKTKMTYQSTNGKMRWCKHGKLPWLTGYEKLQRDTDEFDIGNWKKSVNKIFGLREGSSGDSVKLLQLRLISLNLLSGAADGEFGPKTKHAVEEYQESRKLTKDGIVGINTWTSLYLED